MLDKKYVILIFLLTVYILLQIFHPGGLMSFFYPSILWGILALTTIWVTGLGKIKTWFNKQIFLIAALISAFQIFILLDAGLLLGFGQNSMTYGLGTLAVNALLVFSTLLGIELSRAYLVKTFSNKRPVLTLILITLVYAFINLSFLGLFTFDNPLSLADYLGVTLLPSITESLLASYLALLGGPAASLAYRGPLLAFMWFSPILPNLSWGYEALIGVMIPTLSLISVMPLLTPIAQRKIGIRRKTQKLRSRAKSKNPMMGWVAISIVCVLMVWGSTGLLGFYPTIVASGSMGPTLDVGDLAVIIQVDQSEIQVGDIIQYSQGEELTIHRVIGTAQTEAGKVFLTKGDANNAPDSDPVSANQIRGKLIFTLPKLGWIPIYIKTAIAETVSFFTNNIIIAYTAFTALTIALVSTFHVYWNSPTRKLRRRMHR